MMTQRLSEFGRKEAGSVAVLYGSGVAVLAMAVGAAVTFSELSQVRARHQQHLDAAVLAAVLAPDSSGESERIAVATRAYRANVASSADDSRAAFTIDAQQSSFRVSGTSVSGNAVVPVRNPFPIIGGQYLSVSVRSAAKKAKETPICILGLNNIAEGAFQQNGTSTLDATNCAAQFNSRNGSAMLQQGQPQARATAFGVSGHAQGSSFTPPPFTRSAPVADPFASLPFPILGPCIDASSRFNSSSVTLDPGTYCGGVEVRAGTTLRLNPGVYIMKDGNFTVQSGSTVTGDDVMIAFTGEAGNWPASLILLGGATMRVTSPANGPYAGIQFFGARETYRNLGWPTIGGAGGGAATLDYDGVMYFPTQAVWIFGGSVVTARTPTLAIISEQLWVQDHARLTVTRENTRGLSVVGQTPAIYSGAVLTR
jgi:hypothetical protein